MEHIAGAVRFAGCFECMHFSARLASNGQGFLFFAAMRERVPPPTAQTIVWPGLMVHCSPTHSCSLCLMTAKGLKCLMLPFLKRSGAPGK